MLLFQFRGIAEQWLSQRDFAQLRAWAGHPGHDEVAARLSGPEASAASLGVHRAVLPPESLPGPPLDVPAVTAPTRGVWSSGDRFPVEAGTTASEAFVKGSAL